MQNVDQKDTKDKHDPLLVLTESDRAVSLVSDEGFKKYGNRDSWKNNPPAEGLRKYLSAAIRHAKLGFEIDPDGGLPHVYKVLWNAQAAVWHYEKMHSLLGKPVNTVHPMGPR